MYLTYIAALNVKQNLTKVKRKIDKCTIIKGQIYPSLSVTDGAHTKINQYIKILNIVISKTHLMEM